MAVTINLGWWMIPALLTVASVIIPYWWGKRNGDLEPCAYGVGGLGTMIISVPFWIVTAIAWAAWGITT